MPSRKSVPTLRDLCLAYVSSHIDIWSGENHNRFQKKIIFEDNPVLSLPKTVVDAICNRVVSAKNLQPHHLNMTMHRQIRRINLSMKSMPIVQHGIELISNICSNITHLNLSKNKVCEENLKKLARLIPSIRHLQLSLTATTDDVLSILGEHCPALRGLNVSFCSITDVGIRAFCKKNPGKCSLVFKLIVYGTHITAEGVLIILQNLPHLRFFGYANTLKVLEGIHNRNIVVGCNDQFNLENIFQLHCQRPSISNFTMDAALSLCPNISNILLLSVQESDQWILKLTNFRRLADLSLGSSLQNSLTFDESIVPLLKQCGNNLKSITLYRVTGINLWHIGNYCNQLTTLRLGENYHYPSTIPHNALISKPFFVELRKVKIICDDGTEISPVQLQYLLSSCHQVQDLFFCKCQTLTDELLTRVCERNSFSDLRSMCIGRCNNIGISSLFVFINTCKSLKKLDYNNCALIQRVQHQEIQHRVRCENLNLAIPTKFIL